MSGFAAEWLALRAGADERARDPELLAAAATVAGDGLIADIGGGAGATFRALAPHAPGARWRVLDHDPVLLALLPAEGRVEAVQADLAADPGAAFAPRPRLVTASAFFDLVSAAWIGRFADFLAGSGAALYAALTYDGREEWRPAPPREAEALAAFHADTNRDKGFGPALGPGAHAALAAALRARGYDVREAPSDWRLTRPRDAALIGELARGGAAALAGRMAPGALADWRRGRSGAEEALVGHMDLLATPRR